MWKAKNMVECPNCKENNYINEYNIKCKKCGYIFVECMNLNIDLNSIGQRRSLENVDQD